MDKKYKINPASGRWLDRYSGHIAEYFEDLGFHNLKEVLDLPGNDVYVVQTPQREVLIPVVPQFVLRTDVQEGVITVRMMEGL